MLEGTAIQYSIVLNAEFSASIVGSGSASYEHPMFVWGLSDTVVW